MSDTYGDLLLEDGSYRCCAKLGLKHFAIDSATLLSLVLFLLWNLSSRQGWLASVPQGSTQLYLHSRGMTSAHTTSGSE